MSSTSAINSLLSSAQGSTNTSRGINISSLLAAATGSTSTGIDVSSAVAAAIYAAQAPERNWQAQQADLKAQAGALSAIQSAALTLSDDMTSLNDINGPTAARSVTSTFANVATATASAGAQTGTHVIVVNSLASTGSWYSPAVTSSSAMLGSSSLHISTSVGGSLTIASGSGVNSLDDVAAAINTSSLGVTASVVRDSTGARLAVTGNSTGSGSDFTVSFSPTTGTHWTSASVADSTTGLPPGSFTLSDGNTSAVITVSAGETLDQLNKSINTLGLNVLASITTDSSGSRLAIASANTPFTISTDPVFAFTRASSGKNASLTVDGVPISSETNSVSNAVGGITINLLNASFGAEVNLSISSDMTQSTAAVARFVKDYNAALTLVNAQFAYNPSGQTQGSLSGDASVRSLQNALLGAMTFATGSMTGSSQITLASIGVTMGNNGFLSLDGTKLFTAMQRDSASVQTFFQGVALNGFAHNLQSQLDHFTNPANGGLTIDLKSINSDYSDLQSHIDKLEAGYIASQRTILTSMYSKAEIALQQLPTTLKQIQAELGNTSSGG